MVLSKNSTLDISEILFVTIRLLNLVPTLLILLGWFTITAEAVMYCYSCVSTQPGESYIYSAICLHLFFFCLLTYHFLFRGCGLNSFYYRWHRGHPCSRNEDRCVKLIERRGTDVMVRDLHSYMLATICLHF